VLSQIGLYLGMDVPGWPRENLEQLAKEAEESIDALKTKYDHAITRSNQLRERVSLLETKVSAICQSLVDPWPSKVVPFEAPGNTMINDTDEKVTLYLRSLEMLWQLGLELPPRFKKKRVYTALATGAAVPASIVG
jgi:hypothetical protein